MSRGDGSGLPAISTAGQESLLCGTDHSGQDAWNQGPCSGQQLHRGGGKERYRAHQTLYYSCINLSLSLLGLGLEGLYRVSGMTSEVLKIKKEFDRGIGKQKVVGYWLFIHQMIWYRVPMAGQA